MLGSPYEGGPISAFRAMARSAIDCYAMMAAQERKILKDYSSLMNEVKLRLRTTHAFIHHQQDIPQGLLKECCYVQLRMVCELIALGCLIAHSGIKAAQSGYLKKACMTADKIVAELEKLHPNFFPCRHG